MFEQFEAKCELFDSIEDMLEPEALTILLKKYALRVEVLPVKDRAIILLADRVSGELQDKKHSVLQLPGLQS